MKNYARFLVALAVIFTATLCFGCSSKTDKTPAIQKNVKTPLKGKNIATPSSAEFTDQENQALDAVASDKFLEFIGKTFDKDAAEAKYENEKSNPGVNANSNYDDNIETRLLVTHFMLDENRYNRLLYADSYKFDLDSLVSDGLMAIIPRNPYTGEDIKSSLDYSPGDCFLAADERGIVFIYHTGDKEIAYEPNRKDNTILSYQKNEEDPEFLSDGRSLIHSHKFMPGDYSDLMDGVDITRQSQFLENNNPEFRKLWWLNRQITEMMTRYSQMNENVPKSLEEVIDYFGRINPPAWINPYKGSPMEKVGFTVDVPVPPDLLDEKTNVKSHYAGNYSFATYTDGKDPVAIFAIYFLKPNGDLGALVSQARPKSIK